MPRKRIIPDGRPVTLYLPVSLVERLREKAEKRGLTLSQYLRIVLADVAKDEG